MNDGINYIIDSHTHIFPDKIADKSRTNVGNFYNQPMFTTGTSNELHRVSGMEKIINGKKYKIKYQLICSPAVNGRQTESINNFIISSVKQNTDYIGFGTIHPDNENYKEIIDYIKFSGLKGIKLHPEFQNFNIDDRKMYPVYKYIAKCGMPVLFHAGDMRLNNSSTEKLNRIIKDIPELKIIAAHLGGYMRWNESIALEPSENLYFDISSSLSFISREQFIRFLERFGYKHFFFGSDFPMWYPYGELEKFIDLGLDDEICKAIEYNNLTEFLKI